MRDAIPVTFAVVGVQKAATTTLTFLISAHRQVAKPQPWRKERHFFDREGPDWSAPDYSDYSSPRAAEHQLITGDFTPIYLYHPYAMQRMRAYNPDMRLIASFRDPIERAFSHWQMSSHKYDGFPEFGEAIARELPATLPTAVPSDGAGKRAFRHGSIVTRGLYGAQLERAFDTFPDRSRWLLLDFGDVVTRRDRMLTQLTDFLELHPFKADPTQRTAHRTRPVERRPVTPADVERLVEAFSPDLATFDELSGLDTSVWPTCQIISGQLDPADLAATLTRKSSPPDD